MLSWLPVLLLAGTQPQAPAAPRPDDPRTHQVHFATSPDGLTWEEAKAPVMKMASVPDIIELSGKGSAGAAGTLAIYTVDFRDALEPGGERLARLLSTDDGATWGAPARVTIEGKTTGWAAVDPAVVQLDDGRLRVYFYEMVHAAARPPQQPQPPRLPGSPRPDTERREEPESPVHRILSAISEDGLAFRAEAGARFELPGITDPEVVRCGGEWLMFLSRGEETLLAHSNDGLKFEADAEFICREGGVPGALALDDGTVRIYASARRGIVSTVYDPGRGTFKPDGGLRVRGPAADPAAWRRSNGTYVMAFKRFAGAESPRDPQRPPPLVPPGRP